MVQVNTENTNPDGGGNYIDAACGCHMIVESAEYLAEQNCVEVISQVIKSSPTGQEDKEWKERFWLTDRAVGRFIQLGCATAVCSKEQWRAAREAGQNLNVDESSMLGKQYKIEFQMEPEMRCSHREDDEKCGFNYLENPGDKDKTVCPQCGVARRSWPQSGFRLYSVNEKPEIPVDENFVKSPSASSPGSPQPTAANAPVASDATGQGSEWDDF
jgi:hypothetical protein